MKKVGRDLIELNNKFVDIFNHRLTKDIVLNDNLVNLVITYYTLDKSEFNKDEQCYFIESSAILEAALYYRFGIDFGSSLDEVLNSLTTERLKILLDGERIEMPNGLSREEKRQFLINGGNI